MKNLPQLLAPALMGCFVLSIPSQAQEKTSNQRYTQLTHYNTEGNFGKEVLEPALHAGDRIVYGTDRRYANCFELWSVSINDSSDKRQLTSFDETHECVESRSPVELPDGRILYSTNRRNKWSYELWTINPIDGTKTQLTAYDENDEDYADKSPAVMSDGKVVYSSNRYNKDFFDLWVIDPENPQDNKRITDYKVHGSAREPLPLQNSVVETESCQSTRIVYSSYRPVKRSGEVASFNIWLLEINDGVKTIRQLTRDHQALNLFPAELPDGKIIYSSDARLNRYHEFMTLDPQYPIDTTWLVSFREAEKNKYSEFAYPVPLEDGRIVFVSNRGISYKDRRENYNHSSEIWIFDPRVPAEL